MIRVVAWFVAWYAIGQCAVSLVQVSIPVVTENYPPDHGYQADDPNPKPNPLTLRLSSAPAPTLNLTHQVMAVHQMTGIKMK